MNNKNLLVLALVLTASGSTCLAQETTFTSSYNGYPVAILPDYYDTISVAFINVPRAVKMTKVTARVLISYPQLDDINVFLYSPDGTRVKLLEHNCGNVANVDTTFDDAASSRFSDACPAASGNSYRANEPLSNFNSADSSIGLWTLAVENNSSDSRAGRLIDVTLTITGASQVQPYFRSEQVLNSANLHSGAVAPGQVVTILGTALGPDTPVLAPTSAAWPTSLANVRVNVNGTDVPVRYASSTRLDVQMPFSLAGGTANIKVSYGANVSGTVAVPVTTTFPGLFALQSGGTGQAKAGNQDGTLNSITNPAPKGSYISVYGIGLGAVNPPVAAGQVPPTSPLSPVTNTIAASIGGVPAPVTFAGLAPLSTGLYQINIQVPDAAPSGNQDVIVSIAGNASQNGLTVRVK